MKKGKIIVVEGTDCSGKETQTTNLVTRLILEDIPCERMGFPRYETPTGDVVKRYLGKEPYEQEFGPANEVNPRVASVFYALDRFFALPDINDIIERGDNLLLDRYVPSNMAHQGGKIIDSEERGEFFEWEDGLEYETLGLPRPDLVVFLYMPYQVGMELKKGREGEADGHESNPEHLRNAEQAYLELVDMYKWDRVNCAPDGTIDSLRTVDDISDEVLEKVLKVVRQNP